MKKLVLSMMITAALVACGGGETKTEETKPISNASQEEAATSVVEAAPVA